MSDESMRESAASPLELLHRRVREAYDEFWDRFVDPREPYFDGEGPWRPLGLDLADRGPAAGAFLNEQQHAQIRAVCRELATTNEFAINGHENRISFIVGSGHTYRAAVRRGRAADDDLVARVQDVLDDFVDRNAWGRRQQELVRRRDRDGEVFLRYFTARDGTVRVRFIEPGQVYTPADRATDPQASFGILTDADDVETVRAYFVDGRPVEPHEVQHRKANVDDNVKRGLPLFYPVRKNLRRAEKLLRNMSVLAEIQAAIALIRRHPHSSAAGVRSFAAGAADVSAASPLSGRTTHYKRYAPGTILDAPAGVEYDFPAAGVNAGAFVVVLQAELRAIASRLVMPEFMLTSDASNANYASTLVAEGPAVRMFDRLQAEQAADDLEVMWFAVRAAVEAGRLPVEALVDVAIQAGPPSLAVRNLREEAEAFRIEHEQGILSPQTWSQRRGLDYDQEQRNLAEHRRRAGPQTPLKVGQGQT